MQPVLLEPPRNLHRDTASRLGAPGVNPGDRVFPAPEKAEGLGSGQIGRKFDSGPGYRRFVGPRERMHGESDADYLAYLWSRSKEDPNDPTIRSLILKGVAPVGGAAGTARLGEARAGLRPPVAGVIPFVSASHEHIEPIVDVTATPGASVNVLGSPIDIPATGYLRNIWITVDLSGGTLGAGALAADFPFNIFDSLMLADVNGAPIVGPIDGYALLQQNIYGGANSSPVLDPRSLPFYVATINGTLAIRIPVEISHKDGMGSLANQNSAATYKLYLGLNTAANLFATAPTAVPAARVRAYVEAWTIPNETDVLGRPQAQLPPRLGTAQYISQFTTDMTVGSNTVRLPRVGNLLRTLVFINRTLAAGNPRSDAVFPDPLDLRWDERNIYTQALQRHLQQAMRERVPDLVARDAGVFAIPFGVSEHNGIGDDSPTFWWPTVQSSRVEVVGNSAATGRLQVITCDVAPVEVAPEDRYELENQTGFTPQVGTPVRAG